MIATIIVSASVTSVVTIVIGWAFKRALDGFLGLHRAAQAQWVAERRNLHAEAARDRRELLERIQRPERVPNTDVAVPTTEYVVPEPDDSFLVGQIHWDDAFLNEDASGDDMEFRG